MTTTTALPRLAEAATQARGGADLYRFTLRDRLPDVAFAAQSDGSVLISGMDLLKAGTFNGLTLVDADLEAMAQRFNDLRDAGVFVPPFRLDHSWSVLSVVGYFDNVETYVRVDETDSLRKTFLRGDVRITGSVDYKPAQIIDAIKRGALRDRSSELGYYVTNSGNELPLVFYGCAYVDIPAVEGLAPVTLSKRPTPHKLTLLNSSTEGTDPMDPKKLARLAALRAMLAADVSPEERVELEGLEAEATEAGVTDEDVEAAAVEVDEQDEPEPEAEDESEDEQEPEPEPEPETPVEDTPTAAESAELARLREQVAGLRQAETDRNVRAFRDRGAIVDANEEAAIALLSHDSEDVRRAAGTLLESMTDRVMLGRRRGRTTLSADGATSATGDRVIELGMTNEECGDAWRALTPEERKLRKPELDEWTKYRNDNGIRD